MLSLPLALPDDGVSNSSLFCPLLKAFIVDCLSLSYIELHDEDAI